MIIQKSWGYEQWIENNDKYCMKVIVCRDEKWSSQGLYHYHKIKDETFYIIEGTLVLELRDQTNKWHFFILEPGDHVRIHPYELHRFKCEGAFCKFIEASTHHDEEDSFRTKL
jgi:mannose-6-phosphate isomerase-like protein (cupin superfamily)